MPLLQSDFLSLLEQPLMLYRSAFHALMAEHFLLQRPREEQKEGATILTEDILAKYSDKEINLVTPYTENIPHNSIAYHRVKGVVFYESWWGFNTKQFISAIQAAEENPAICAHFIHVDSPGGVAYGLDRAAEAVKMAKKPIIGFVEGYACSAGYFLVAHADTIYTATQFDTVGSVGTMISFMDFEPYYEKLGVKFHEIYAEQSKLKNDTTNQALKGKYDKIKRQCLNPLAEDFINTVKEARKNATDEDIYQGESYFATVAQEKGLTDGVKTIEEALQLTLDKGKKHMQRNNILTTF